MEDSVVELSANLKGLSDLYNDYACPLQQWALALEMIGLAKYNNPAYIKQLWDVYLRQVNLLLRNFTLVKFLHPTLMHRPRAFPSVDSDQTPFNSECTGSKKLALLSIHESSIFMEQNSINATF